MAEIDTSLDLVLAHGRAALYFHSSERGRMFRCFVFVLTAAVAGAIYCSFVDRPGLALGIGFFMVMVALMFKFIDYRSRKLIHYAEEALLPAESRLAEASGLPAVALTARSQENRNMSHTILYQASYTVTIILSLFLMVFTYSALSGG